MKCFYHSADFDGMCSGAIVKKRFPQCEMIGINYGQKFPWESIKKNEIVYMVDFGLQPFEDMIELNKISQLFWIDHHKTSVENSTKYNFKANSLHKLKIGEAGCELTWDYMFPHKTMPLFVHLLGRYDVWDHENVENVLEFQYGMRIILDTLPDNQQFWNSLYNPKIVESIIENGKLILQYEHVTNAKFCNTYAFDCVFCDMTCIAVNKGFTNSQVFDSVYDSTKHDMMLTFSYLPKIKKWTVSLYSDKPNVDCSSIAKIFGGGGHKGAAGFQIDDISKLGVL